MASTPLTGTKRKDTYTWLLHVGTATLNGLKRVFTGAGTETALSLGPSSAKVDGDLTVTGTVTAASLEGAASDVGNLTADGMTPGKALLVGPSNNVVEGDAASDVSDLTTDGLTPGRALVVDDPGGVTELALGSAATAATTDFAAASHSHPSTIAAEIAAAPSFANPGPEDALALRYDEGGVLGKITWGNVASKFAAASHSHPAAAHNGLDGLQGGQSAEYYHLTKAQHDVIGTPNAHAASHAIDGVTWIATNVAAESTIMPAAIVSRTAGTYKLVVAVTFSADPTNRTIVFGRSGTGEFKDPADGTATASIDAQGTEFTMQCGAGDGTTRYAFVTFTCAGTETISATGVSGTINSVSVGVISRETAQTDTVMVDAASQAIGILQLANGGTGAATAGAALTNLGATAVGSSLVTAATAGAALTNLGATAIGSSLFAASNKADAKTAIGIVNMTPAAYTALVVAGTVDATTLYLLTE